MATASSLLVNLGECLNAVLAWLYLVVQASLEATQKNISSFKTRSASESGREKQPRLTNSRIGKVLAHRIQLTGDPVRKILGEQELTIKSTKS